MEARRTYRLDLSGELTLTEGRNTHHGNMLNVGLSGIMALVPLELEVDSRYFISFGLRPGRAIFKSWARVAWRQEHEPGSYLIGFQFERTDSEMHRVLADYISERWIREHLAKDGYGVR